MLLEVNAAPVVGISTMDVASMKELKSAIAVAFLRADPHFSVLLRMQLKSPTMIQGLLGCNCCISVQSCLHALMPFAPYTTMRKKLGLLGDETAKCISWLVSNMEVRATLFQFQRTSILLVGSEM